ncbi:MAG: hypothetical protein KatS3mg068_2325 [Candidatus Sericytochromatia bacterium]|nr:MAG: hypothetical protein KatS3mg068_2325 [Candidatus Sericytochromatia bacterium]GIX42990.1 MAG: hypothetical protein KatS3mg129_2723 [Leptospiraceae bacterium]
MKYKHNILILLSIFCLLNCTKCNDKKQNKDLLLLSLLLNQNTSIIFPRGIIDTEFGDNGFIKDLDKLFNLNSVSITLSDIKIQKDGKFIVSGIYNNGILKYSILIRFNANGSIDNSFDYNGIVIFKVGDESPENTYIFIQDDNKILICGNYLNSGADETFLARFNSNGSFDTSFGLNGIKKIDIDNSTTVEKVKDIKINKEGNIIITGYYGNPPSNYDIFIAKFDSIGNPITNFGTNGIIKKVITSNQDYPEKLLILNDGKILIGGISYSGTSNYNIFLIRYNNDGTIDNTFGTNGITITDVNFSLQEDILNSFIILNDGSIMICGYTKQSGINIPLIGKYNSDGNLNSTFGNNGFKTFTLFNSSAIFYDLAIQLDGKILLGGSFDNDINLNDSFMLRLNENLELDESFGINGIFTNDVAYTLEQYHKNDYIDKFLLLPEGKILILGNYNDINNSSSNYILQLK